MDSDAVVDAPSLLQDLLCPVCTDLVDRDTGVQTTCGHLFCCACIETHIRVTQPEAPARCPLCNTLVTHDSLQSIRSTSPLLYRLMGQVQVKCHFWKEGCTWRGCLSDLQSHLATCRHRTVSCPHCGKNVRQNEMQRHAVACMPLQLQNAKTVVQQLKDELRTMRAQTADLRERVRASEAKTADLSSEVMRLKSQLLAPAPNCYYDRTSVVELGRLIAQDLENRPSDVDQNRTFQSVLRCMEDLKRGYADNPPYYKQDCRFMLAAVLGSTWFSERQYAQLFPLWPLVSDL